MKQNMDALKSLLELYVRSAPGSNLDKIVIFGAGKMGVNLLAQLRRAGYTAAYFCDNNASKQSGKIEGVPVISFNELLKQKNNVIVFVSPVRSEEIYKQLEYNGFPFVFPMESLQAIKFIPVTKVPGAYQNFYSIGHYYSLYPELDSIMEKQDVIFDPAKKVLDIDFNLARQRSLYEHMRACYDSIPVWKDLADADQESPYRYRYGNPSLSVGDAVHLHCMLRVLKPKRLIEVGSGFTSAITLDTNEFYLDKRMELSFIEPYPDQLRALLKPGDNIELHECGLQEIPVSYFEKLEDGDVLFIDSTHVSKIGSDVNYFFFEIFPRLKSGVYIHLHDIFYPFEYPKQWIVDGMIWNELYVLRAFLQNNSVYSIQFFQNMMEKVCTDLMSEKWPFQASIHGGSFWMRKEIG